MAEDNSRKRLGRGLAALIGDSETAGTMGMRPSAEARSDRKAPIEHLRANANNPRRHFNDGELDDLARSIREHGIVQPILVRTAKNSEAGAARFEIIAGERRWRAAQRAGLHEVPIIIREVEDRQALELAIIENIQRADLNALEEARGYQQLIEEYKYSQSDLGDVIGKSRSHVANTLRLLKLPAEVQELVNSGALSAGHARTLVTAQDPRKLAERIVNEGLSVRQAEMLAQETQQEAGAAARPGRAPETKNADAAALERRLSDLLGLQVTVNWSEAGAGDIKIRYRTLDQLEGVCRRLENGR
jgi:ParB family transcriptional regulator, chromosome partitioning protein